MQLSALLECSKIREETRAIFRALLEHCEDRVRLSNFVLESIKARISTYQPITVPNLTQCDCNQPVHGGWAEIEVEVEALNDEAHSWLVDFLLYSL
jgi:hypothetical protein